MDWVWELTRTVVGSFAGAWMAFNFNALAHRTKQDDERVVAGNLALLALRGRINDLYLVRRAMRDQAFQRWQRAGGKGKEVVPLWSLAPHTHTNFSTATAIDLGSLAFVLARPEGREALRQLQMNEVNYSDFQSIATLSSESAGEAQRLVSERVKTHAGSTWREMEEHLGKALTAKVRDQFVSLVVRCDDIEGYKQTYAAVFAALRVFYGPRVIDWGVEPGPGFALEDLPEIPPPLQEGIEKMRAQGRGKTASSGEPKHP